TVPLRLCATNWAGGNAWPQLASKNSGRPASGARAGGAAPALGEAAPAASVRTNKPSTLRQRPAWFGPRHPCDFGSLLFGKVNGFNVWVGASFLILELPGPTHGKLELAGTAAVLVMADWDAVVEPQRTDGEVEAQAKTPVVAELAHVEVVGTAAHAADVVEKRGAHADAALLLEDRDAVFRRPKPIGVAADGFVIARLARADVAVFEAAQRVRATQIITFKKRNVWRVAERVDHPRPPSQLQHVAFGQTLEVPAALEFQLVELPVEPDDFPV